MKISKGKLYDINLLKKEIDILTILEKGLEVKIKTEYKEENKKKLFTYVPLGILSLILLVASIIFFLLNETLIGSMLLVLFVFALAVLVLYVALVKFNKSMFKVSNPDKSNKLTKRDIEPLKKDIGIKLYNLGIIDGSFEERINKFSEVYKEYIKNT